MILLHSCCGPCSAAVLPQLNPKEIIVYFYNPSIYRKSEYEQRLEAQIQVCEYYKVQLIVPEYDYSEFSKSVTKYTSCPEQGSRCTICFYDRFVRTAEAAKELGIDTVATTLTVSPYKDSKQVLHQLRIAATNAGIQYLKQDFKGGTSELPFEIYEQEFCGCEYSVPAQPIQKCERNCSHCLKN